MKTLIIALSILSADTLPPKATLLHAIDSFFQIQKASQLLEYQISKKGEWLKYLPTVGIQYTLDGKPRPTLSFSSNILYRVEKDRQTVEAKRRTIIEKNKLEAQKAKNKLEEMLKEYQMQAQELKSRKEVLKIDSLLFQIDQVRYDSLEMASSEYLKAKKKYLQQQIEVQNFEHKIQRLRRRILIDISTIIESM